MYLNRLSMEEKGAFYAIAHALAASDNGVSTKEQAILDSVLGEMQISRPEKLAPVSEALTVFQLEEHKRIVLLELMLIALVDDDFAAAEQRLLSQVVDAFALSESHVERAATWAESILGLFRSGQRFIQFS